MAHIDIDDGTSSALLSNDDAYNKTNQMIIFLDNVSKTHQNISQYRDAVISKIVNINYSDFIHRYFRNCIILNIEPKEAYVNYQAFWQKMCHFCQHHPILSNYRASNINNNWFKTLDYGICQFYNNFKTDQTLKQILDEQRFTQQFLEYKQGYNYQYNKQNISQYIKNGYGNNVISSVLSIADDKTVNNNLDFSNYHHPIALCMEDKRAEQIYQTFQRYKALNNNSLTDEIELVDIKNIGLINVCGIGVC